MRPRLLENKEHLARVAGLFVAGIVVFVVLRAWLVPKGFGLYGHFRPGALADNSGRPLAYAGRATCGECHTDEAGMLKAGKHASIGCEACHGALGKHAEDPSVQTPVRPNGRTVCLRCHLANVAKPATFPQIEVAEHAPDGLCTQCHAAHSPGVK